MHPYRNAPMSSIRRRQVDPDDFILYALFVIIGLIPVVIALVDRAPFGFDATLGLMMAVVGIIGMVVARSRPRATSPH